MKLTIPFALALLVVIGAITYYWMNAPSVDTLLQTDKQTEEVPQESKEYYRLDVVLHRIVKSGEANTSRSEELVRQLIGGAGQIWLQADIAFGVDVEHTILPPKSIDEIIEGDLSVLEDSVGHDGKLHVFFVNTHEEIDSTTLGSSIVVIADNTTVDSTRLLAHEIGHLFGLERVDGSKEHLMAKDGSGTALTETGIAKVQQLLELSISGQGQTEGI